MKKKRNIINKKKAIELFEAYGIEVQELNDFTFRLFQGETKQMWDWYHTTGTLHKHIGKPVLIGKYFDIEDVALLVNKEE